MVAEDAAPCKSSGSKSSSVSPSLELSKQSIFSFGGISNLVCHDDKSTDYAEINVHLTALATNAYLCLCKYLIPLSAIP